MTEEEKTLSIFNEVKLVDKYPKRQLDSIAKFHNEFYSFFRVNEFLKMLNEKFFDNKGEVLPAHSFYGLEPKINVNKVSESRFNKYFALEANLQYSDLESTLRIKNENLLSNKKEISYLDISIYSEINPGDDLLFVFVQGELNINGNFKQKAIYLSQVGESRSSAFPLSKPAQPEEIARDLFRGTSEILQGFADQGFIKLPKPNSEDHCHDTNSSQS